MSREVWEEWGGGGEWKTCLKGEGREGEEDVEHRRAGEGEGGNEKPGTVIIIVDSGAIGTAHVKHMCMVVAQPAYGCERATMVCDRGDGEDDGGGDGDVSSCGRSSDVR
jgi:hypothetical protein